MKTSLLTALALSVPFVLCGGEPVKSERAARAEIHRKMRIEYAASQDYNPYADGLQEIRRTSAELLEKGQFEKAISEAGRGLAIDRLNIDLLMTSAAAHRAKGDTAKADELRQRWMSLVDSIVDRSIADGRSFDTAFRVISVDEEYAVLSVFHLNRTWQSLVEHGGSEFDVLKVRGENGGEEFELYFNVDIPKNWLRKRFETGDKNKRPNQAP